MDDNWRLINGKKLYDLRKDPGQETDIAKKYPEKVQEMRAVYEKWWTYTSREFGRYEAYKIGAPHIEETCITAHDLHTFAPVTWDQSYIRDPYSSKKPSLGTGYWMIDVQQEGEYEIELRRWPKESALGFSDTIPQLNTKKPWLETKPAGIKVDIKSAMLDIEGIHMEQNVDVNNNKVSFKAYLCEGRQHLEANFIGKEDKKFSAFYVYIKKVK